MFPIVTEKSTTPFPESHERSKALAARFEKARTLDELFEIKGVVPLNESLDGVLAVPHRVLNIEGQWFIYDIAQGLVFQYDADGNFQRKVGRQGQGPGEWESIAAMGRYGKMLAISDGGRGDLLIYDLMGQHIQTFSFFKKLGRMAAAGSNFFIEGNRFYGCEASPALSPLSAHVIIDLERMRVLKGFGKRYRHAEEAQIFYDYTFFERFGDHIWIASPYASSLEVYDMEGRFAKRLFSPVEGFEREDLDSLRNEDDYREMLRTKHGHMYVFNTDELLLDFYAPIRDGRSKKAPVSLFDVRGNRIATVRDGGRLVYGQIKGGYKDTFVAVSNLGYFQLEALQKDLSPRDYQYLRDHGFDPETEKEKDRSWLILLGLID